MALVQTSSLTKSYGRLTALDGCSLDCRRGEVLGLLGPNGSGKTTLLRLLMGFLRPTRGTATIDGLDCHRDSVAVHARVAYLPGETRLFRTMRGRDVLSFFARVRPEGSLPRSLVLAERLDVDLSRRVAFCSTGMRQKLALAVVLAFDTPLLILDEPTSNLDPTVRGEVVRLVREAKQAGRTVIFSSHVLSEVEQACDRVAILRKGKLVHTQSVAELGRRHRIAARLNGPLPPLPASLAASVSIEPATNGELRIETGGELAPVVAWLATLPLAELSIAPLGLSAVYSRFHGGVDP